VEALDVVELELNPGRELGELLVEGDLEAEHRVPGTEVALHGDGAVAGVEAQQLEAPGAR
jgi:hypothetical protein